MTYPVHVINMDLVQNLAVLTAICAAAGMVGRRWIGSRRSVLLHGVIFGSAAVLSMMAPLHLASGVQFDGRSIAIGLCAAFFGPGAGLISSAMAGACRIAIGGSGVWTGLLVILGSAGLGTLFHYRFPITSGGRAFLAAWGLGLAVHVLMLALMFTLPGGLVWTVLPDIAATVLIVYPLTTAFIGMLLADQRMRSDDLGRLREREEQLRLFLHNAPAAIAMLDTEMRYIAASRRWYLDYGLGERDITGRSHYEVFPEISDDWKAIHQRCLAGASESREEDPFPREDGKTDWVRWAIIPWRDARGDVGGIIIFSEVISERKNAEMARLAATRLLECTYESLNDAVFVIEHPSRTIVRSNSAAERLFGYTPDELVGQSARLLHIDEEHYAALGRLTGESLALKQTLCTEIPLRRKDGTRMLTETTINALEGSASPSALLVSVVRDITARRESEEALRRSEALLRMAGEVAHVGGWSVEVPSETVSWSEQVRTLHGKPGGFQPNLDDCFQSFVPESRAHIIAAFETCVREGAPFDLELEMVTPGKRNKWVRCMARAERDAGGAVVRVQGATQNISDLKDFERMVAQGQQRFRQLANAVPIVVWTADPDGRIDFANDRFLRYVGARPDEPPSNYWADAIHPNDRARALALWASAVRGNREYSAEFRVRRHDGEYRWHFAQGGPIRDDDGTTVKWYGTATDVHDTKMNEENLARMAARLTATLESITDAFYTLDHDWRFTYLNSEAERLLQYPKNELLGRGAGEVFREARGTEIEVQFGRALKSREAVHFEVFYEPFGRWFEVHAYPSEEGLAVYFRDVSERVKAETELRTLSKRLQNLLDFSPLVITEIDTQGRYILINKAASAVLSKKPDEVLGRQVRDVFTGELADRFMDRIQSVARNRAPLLVEDTIPSLGTEKTFSTILFPLIDERDQVTSIAGIAQDISEQKRAREERDRLESQLRQAQKLEAVGQLAGGIAHDFNNMLSVILGHTEMALAGLADDDPLRHPLDEIQHAAARSAELTRQLLAFARKQTIAPRVLDLTETVAGMLKILRRLVGEDIDIQWHPAGEPLPVLADPSQIDQIVANLAVNARDAIRGNGIVTIESGAAAFDEAFCLQHPEYRPGVYAMVAISDNGCGMDGETISHIFEPFFTTKPLGGGTGLGLATVYGIVQQNDGFIAVSSTPGSGSAFRIYFPRYLGIAPLAGGTAIDRGNPLGSETLLLVEDELALLRLSTRMLQSLGYTVLAACSPTEAFRLSAAHEGRIHLLITDVVMPEMNGRDLREKLVGMRPDLRTLYMSGYTADVIDRRGALDEGVHFLPKPFKIRQLADKVREALDAGTPV